MKTISSKLRRVLALGTIASVLVGGPVVRAEDSPTVDVTKSAAIQRYKLKSLTNAQLQAVERKPEKPYTTIYETLLTRKGLERKYREEAANALSQIKGTDVAVELLNGLTMVPEDDKGTSLELIGLLLAQQPEALAKQNDKLREMAEAADKPAAGPAALAALAVADGEPEGVWQFAQEKDTLTALLNGIELIPAPALRSKFYEKVSPLVSGGADEAQKVAAIESLSAMPGHEAEVFKTLAGLIESGEGAVREAAMRSLRKVPAETYPKEAVEPLAKKLIEVLKAMPVDQRSEATGLEAVQLGNQLASALPGAAGNAIRKELRSVAVQVVAIRTYREQMLYDTRYFVVQSGKPVKVVLENDDFMPHNIVITAIGSLEKVGTAASGMTPPTDEKEKAYVPDMKEVLEASHLAQGDETVSISFKAPLRPGEYPFVCTFPGHWVRMYGVMLVVPNLDQYERNPKPPLDPLTRKPYTSTRQEPLGAPPPGTPAAVPHTH